MKRDGAREAQPEGSVWNLVNFLPEVLGALCRKRGGYKYASVDLATLNASAGSVLSGIVAEYTAGQSVLAMDNPTSRIYEIESPTTTENIGLSTAGGCRNPVFYEDIVIWPEHTGVNPPCKTTRSGATHTNAVLGGTPPAGKYALVYKDVLWLAGGNAFPKRIYFSKEGDPQIWDQVVKWWEVSYPISGMAGLSNAVLIFSLQRTTRIRGSKPPPDDDFLMDDPVFEVGCTDNRSIRNYRDKVIFANAQGLYMTDGVALEDLTRVCGMKAWWRDMMKGRDGFSTGTQYNISTWSIAGGIYDDFYFYSIMNGTTLVDAGMVDLVRYAWTRLDNIDSAYFFDRLYPQELFWGRKGAARVATISDIFVPTTANEIDADGDAVLPSLETPFFAGEPGVKTFQTLFVTYDLTTSGGTPPVLRVSYALNPEATAYTDLTPDLLAGGHNRTHLEMNLPGLGAAFRIVQVGKSTDTRLHTLSLAAQPRERSR